MLLLSDVDERMDDIRIPPRIGFYMVRLRSGCPEVPARIWRRDHEPGDPTNLLDRAPHHAAEISGEEADPYAVMIARERREISEAEYAFQCASVAWSKQWEPTDPRLSPTKKVRLGLAPPVVPD